MKIMDAHCDVLLKLLEDPTLDFYEQNDKLHVTYENMVKANVVVQVFALFVPPTIPPSQRFNYVLAMIDNYYEKVVKPGFISPIHTKRDLESKLETVSPERGVILSLEGADALEGNANYLRTLYRLGLRALGFTWNHRNEAADGVEEPNPGGLSMFGREVLAEANRLGIVLDISHLSVPGFWDVVELSSSPFIASHSNSASIHQHRRNLSDEQLKAIFQKDGVVGLTFVPYFVSDSKSVNIDDLLRHLEHMLSLGGENHVAFGSDFDGISHTMTDLQDTGKYPLLIEALLKRYSENQVEKWMYKNWQSIFTKILG